MVKQLADGTYQAVSSRREIADAVRVQSAEQYVYVSQGSDGLEVYRQVRGTWNRMRKIRWLVWDKEGRMSLSDKPDGDTSTTLVWYIVNLDDDVLKQLYSEWLNKKERALYQRTQKGYENGHD